MYSSTQVPEIDPEFSGNVQVLRKQNNFVNMIKMSENFCGGVASVWRVSGRIKRVWKVSIRCLECIQFVWKVFEILGPKYFSKTKISAISLKTSIFSDILSIKQTGYNLLKTVAVACGLPKK